MTNFAGQTAIVTGASSGIGWELAKLLAADGARVGLVARREDRLKALTAEIERTGGKAAWAAADIADRAAAFDALHRLAQQLGPVDLLVANSGIASPTSWEPPNGKEVEHMIRVNLFGVLYCVEAVLPEMLRRGRGHLAAISSMAAYKGLPGEGGYCASKASVNAYMESLRIQFRERGIFVTTVCPGFVRTPMTAPNQFPMPWLIEADDAARRILVALKRRAKVLNFPWQMSLLMWLLRWTPDFVIARRMKGFKEAPPGVSPPAAAPSA